LSHAVPDLGLMQIVFSLGICSGFCGQIEHLEEGSIKSDQILLDEGISGPEVIVHRKLEQGTNGIVGVKGQTLAVGDQNEEKVQEQLFLIEGRKKTVGDKAMRDKTETTFDPSYPLRPENPLFDHGLMPPLFHVFIREALALYAPRVTVQVRG
jgi:hypothetical protein